MPRCKAMVDLDRFYTHSVNERGARIGRIGRALRRCAAALIGTSAALCAAIGPADQPQATPDPAPVPAARQAANVAVITIRGEIDAHTVRSVERRIGVAARSGADALVFELDTPGGAMGASLDLSAMIKDSPIPNTVAWIHSDALSGGVFVALACREIVAGRNARLGDAAPIQINPLAGIQSLGETERQKLLVPLVADVVDSARRNGHDEKLVQGFVGLGVELWLVEHEETHRRMFIDKAEYEFLFGRPPPRAETPVVVGAGTLAPPPERPPLSLPADQPPAGGDGAGFVPAGEGMAAIGPRVSEELSRIGSASKRRVLTEADRGRWRDVAYFSDGSTLVLLTSGETMVACGLASAVIDADDDLRAFFGATNLARLNESIAERVVRAVTTPLTNPIAQGLLVVVFIVCLFLEMASPGVSVPGIIAMVALVALLAPALLVGMAAWWEVSVIVLGVVCIGVEVFVLPGFGIFGVLGILMLFGGFVATFVNQGSVFPDTPGAGSGALTTAVTTLVLAVATSGVAIWFISRHIGSIPVLNHLVLTGAGNGENGGDDELLRAMAAAVTAAPAIGEVGRTMTPLRPVGTAMFGDRIVEVHAEEGFIAAGVRVRVSGTGDFGRPLVVADPSGGALEGQRA